jgi:hypothetical protein
LGLCSPLHSDKEKVTVADAGMLVGRDVEGVNLVMTYSFPFRPSTEVTTASTDGALLSIGFAFTVYFQRLNLPRKQQVFSESGVKLA